MSSKTKITATKEDAKPALVPKLRFPEFRKTPAWEPTTIGALGNFYYGKSAPKWSLSDDAPTPCVRYGELYTKFGPIITETYSRTNTPTEALRFSKGGEILIPRVGEKPEDFGKCCCYLPLKGIAIGEMISVLETKQHPLFYTHYFRHLHKQFATVVEGQNVKNLYYVELQPLPIHRPSVAEQQKIAECLSSVDELMAAQARKVDALKTHKKGLMQQLFPREGETQPRLRFPEFRNTKEWESIELGEKVDLLSGYPFDGPDISQDSSGIPLLRGINVTEGRIRHNSEIDRFYVGSTEGLEKFRVQANDLVIGMDGSKVGKNSALVSEADAGALLIQRVARLRAKKASLIQFIFQRIHSPSFHTYVDRINTSSGIPHISAKQIKEFRICFPSIPEQHRIADCLSSLDALITAETQKLEALKIHKKALMQQLFPSPEEVGA